MIDPRNPENLQRLRSSIERSREDLEKFRKLRHELISQYVGSHYSRGDDQTQKSIPVNVLELAASIYTMQVVGQRPRATVLSGDHTLGRSRSAFQLAINHLIEEINLEETLSIAFLDAFFLMGIVKVGNTREKLIEIEGFLHDVGQPSADIVDFDDWVHDTDERRYEQVKFCGDKYRLPFDYVKESGLFDAKALEKVSPINRQRKDEMGNPTADTLSTGNESTNPDVQDYVELWDIWLPLENLVITLDDNSLGLPLRIVEWEGPEMGPYHLLRLNDVPSNIMPTSPASQLYDLQRTLNMGYRKLFRSAARSKRVGMYQDAEAGRRVKEANDGDMIAVDDVSAVSEAQFGGIDNNLLAFMIHTNQQFSRQAGNLDVLGGLSPQAGTLGQEQLLSTSANNRVAHMQGRQTQFTEKILRSLGWHIWYDPMFDPPLVKPIPGTSQLMSVSFTEEDREGDFLDYNVRIEPYSMTYKSPEMRLQQMNGVLQGVIFPMLPMLQQEGLTLDIEAILELYAEYGDLPRLRELIQLSEMQQNPQGGGDQARQSPFTSREEIRRGQSGASPQGADQVMQQMLMGMNPGSQDMSGGGVDTRSGLGAVAG